MSLTEPMTLATDYALALLGGWLGWRLSRASVVRGDLRAWWARALWGMAAAAFFGGTFHGFTALLPGAVLSVLWKLTMLAIGVASGCLVLAAVGLFAGARGRHFWLAVVIAKFAFYATWVLAVDDSFRSAVVDYSLAMLVALVAYGARAVSGGAPWAWWVVSGVLVSFVAAAIQRSGWALHRHFNHNDLYHVVQMVGLALLYRGAASAEPRNRARRAFVQ